MSADAVMNAPTQNLGCLDSDDDESPLSRQVNPPPGEVLVTGLSLVDSRATEEALRDAASAAAALRAARGEMEVIPLAELNPYALAASAVPTEVPKRGSPKRKIPGSRARRRRPRLRKLCALRLGWSLPRSSEGLVQDFL